MGENCCWVTTGTIPLLCLDAEVDVDNDIGLGSKFVSPTRVGVVGVRVPNGRNGWLRVRGCCQRGESEWAAGWMGCEAGGGGIGFEG